MALTTLTERSTLELRHSTLLDGGIIMGIFFDRPTITEATISAAIQDALTQDAATMDVAAEAAARTEQLQPHDGGLKVVRLLASVAILLAFVVAAVWTDATGLDDSSKALFGFATTIMGVIVGLLAGENGTSHS